MNYNNPGAIESVKDSRTIQESTPWLTKLSTAVTLFPDEVGNDFDYIFSQDSVGICTAAALITGVWNKTSIRYSEDFNYFLQKKYFDNIQIAWTPWFEGSSPFTAIKAGEKFGLVRKDIVDVYFERLPNEQYSAYINRMISAFTPEVEALLLSKAEKVITGYTQIGTDNASLSTHVVDKSAFIINRYVCGNTWYSKTISGIKISSWGPDGDKIEPISEPYDIPGIQVSGHMVCLTKVGNLRKIANTFGPNWTKDGHAYIDYKPTEAWKVYIAKSGFVEKEKLPIKKDEFSFKFKNNLYAGVNNPYEVELLQLVLMYENCLDFVSKEQRGKFGPKTVLGVIKFQNKYGIKPSLGYVGQATRKKLNELYADKQQKEYKWS